MATPKFFKGYVLVGSLSIYVTTILMKKAYSQEQKGGLEV
jgi:hypothetical protein